MFFSPGWKDWSEKNGKVCLGQRNVTSLLFLGSSCSMTLVMVFKDDVRTPPQLFTTEKGHSYEILTSINMTYSDFCLKARTMNTALCNSL